MVERIDSRGDLVSLFQRRGGSRADCPACGTGSVSVHGRYQRRLVDTALCGRRVELRLTVRRFRCREASCPSVTFAERFEDLTRPYSRFTTTARLALTEIGRALAGRAGTRLTALLGLPAGRTVLLDLVRAVPETVSMTSPALLGVDEFALRRAIKNPFDGVRDVQDEDGRGRSLRGGGGYLPPSITQLLECSCLFNVSCHRRPGWSPTVLGDDDAPIAPIERYLAYLTDIKRSPNTVKAYAHDLKDYFVFLAQHGLDWREVRLEDIGEFVAWLRRPPRMRGGPWR